MTGKPPEAIPEPEMPGGFSLALNFVPVCWLAGGLWLTGHVAQAGGPWVWIGLGWLFLLLPLLGRIVITLFGRPVGTFGQNTRGYRVWWALSQLQTPYNRLPMLEEALRLVPALYPLWIALWGGKVSAMAFVSPGCVITDRHLVRVDRRAVLGFRTTLAGHMVVRDEAGRWKLVCAAPVVEEAALTGGDTGLAPGARVRRGAMLPYGRQLPPFATYPREDAG